MGTYDTKTAQKIKNCFSESLKTVEKIDITNIIQACYAKNMLTFNACDDECIITYVVPSMKAAYDSKHEDTSYDISKVEEFHLNRAEDNVELCYYNCN